MRAEEWRRAALAGVAVGLISASALAQGTGGSSGVPTGGSAGPTSSLPGPSSQPGAGEPSAGATPDGAVIGRPSGAEGSRAGGSAAPIDETQVRRALEQAGYTGVTVTREGGALVARGALNGAAKRFRIDPQTGQATPW